MWKHINEKYKKADLGFIKRMVYYTILMVIFVITVWVCIDAPVQRHFRSLGKNDVWFGDNWYYVGDNTPVDTQGEQYLKIITGDGNAEITKIIDFTPAPDDYMCFRVRAQDVSVYVNDELFYQNSYSEKYRDYAKQMYLLHQMPVNDIQEGDQITIELSSEGADFFNLQFPAIGDRYALIRYIVNKSGSSLGVCFIAIIVIIISIIISHSPILLNKVQDVKSLNLLTVFLILAVIYLSSDSGCMEIFIERTAVVNWLKCISLILLPIPFAFFTKNAFFPGHNRYELLAFLNLVLCVVSVGSFVLFAYNMVNFFIYVHILVAMTIVACILSFVQERTMPVIEVIIGFGSIIITAAGSVIAYWSGIVAPASIVFGYGLLIFSICMLVWIIRNRYEINSMRNEVDHVLMEREKKAAEDASEQKSRFLSHMSHEIRTPLNAILGMNELIMHETQNENIKRYTDNIQSAGRTLLALINDVLDFSKIETGKMDIVETNYSLSSVLNDIVLMIQGRADDKGLEFRLDVDGNMPDGLRGDEIRIKQIILNLMTNAVKYTNEGWIQLSVNMKEVSQYLDEENVVLVVRVSDSGIGIKKEEEAKLFKEFERLDQQKNRSIEGSGLGLSITSRLVTFMNGKISVNSVYGEGSTFTVEIPQKIVSHSPIGDYKKRFELLSNEKVKQKETQEESLENMHFTGKSVFVVDDNEMNLDVIASILELLDIKVEKAGGGQEAINRLDKERFDLILTDDMMPGVDGKQVMLHLHENTESANHTTPIVVLTANAVVGAREEYTGIGFDAYMTKPIDIDVLQKILIKYLK